MHSWDFGVANETVMSISKNELLWLIASQRVYTRAITVSGIGIASQLRRIIFFPLLRAINLNPPCRFPLSPRQIAPFFLGR
jgi:hypothetical protein